MKNPAREKSFEMMRRPKDVRINFEKIRETAGIWLEEGIAVPEWPADFHFRSPDYIFILDSLNFCFWAESGKDKWNINYRGKSYDGYFALSLALKDFFENNPEKGNLKYFSDISRDEFISILQGGENLQFVEERFEIIKSVSRSVGSAGKFLESAEGKFSKLVGEISKLPYFGDPFLKRAQILACDIYGARLGNFEDPGYLTAFADYKVPQILNRLGILEYSPKLDKKIKGKVLIPPASQEEMELRAGTIVAVEHLREALSNKLYSFEMIGYYGTRPNFQK